MVTKDRLTRVLACEAHHDGTEFGQRAPTVAMACGAIVDVLFRQLVTVGSIGDPMADGLAALSVDDHQAELVSWIERLPGPERDELRAEVERQADGLVRRWPALDPAWLPRTQEALRVGLAGGAVELSARVDLAIGRPARDRASVAIVEVKSGARRIEHRADLHFYALVEALRSPAPPFVVATYYTRTGRAGCRPGHRGAWWWRPVGGRLAGIRALAGPDATGAPADDVRPVELTRQLTAHRRRLRSTNAVAPLGHPATVCDLRRPGRLVRAPRRPDDDILVTPAPPPSGPGLPRAVGRTATEPFAWKPLFVRRSLGLAIVEACVTGRFRTPMEAAGPVAAEAVAGWERTGWRTFHWEPWFAGLAAGARATVLAEAVGWATSLWSAFEWRSIGSAGRGRRGGRPVELSGAAPGAAQGPFRAAGGAGPVTGQDRADPAGASNRWRWSRWPAVARADRGTRSWPSWPWPPALRSPSRPVPARVLGLWPDAGAHRPSISTADLLPGRCRPGGGDGGRRGRGPAVGGGPELGSGRNPKGGHPEVGHQKSALAALASGFPAAVSGISSTTSIWRGIL